MAACMLTAARVREVLHYDQDTGVFTRRLRIANCVNVGDVAGGKNPKGYIHIRLDGRQYKAHRLAWLYMTGAFPMHCIDHLDGRRENNAWENLRDVTSAINSQNMRSPHANNVSGFLGVTWTGTRWRASIKRNGKNYFIGAYKTPELAHSAYIEAKRKFHLGCTL